MMTSSSLSKSAGAFAVAALCGTASGWAAPLANGQAAYGLLTAAGGALIYSGWALSRHRRAVAATTGIVKRIAAGDFEARLVLIREGGGTGRLMHAVNDMTDRIDAFVRESAAAMDAVRNNRYHRRILPQGLNGALLNAATTINDATTVIQERVSAFNRSTASFEEAINAIAGSLADASSQMGHMAGSMEEGAGLTNERASAVAVASEEMAISIQTVAAAATQLSASAQEVVDEAERSAAMAREAVSRTKETERVVQGLSGAAERIGRVVELINAIADQTNLLALNATIEAARAGESGRGFAVVANEVKTLAGQTAKATEQIAQQIGELQGTTGSAVKAITDISRLISDIDASTSHIAQAIASQTAATTEIARNVEQASGGSRNVTANIQAVSENALESRSLAGSVLASAADVSTQGRRLGEEVKSFLISLRRGPLDRRQEEDASYAGPERRERAAKRSKAA